MTKVIDCRLRPPFESFLNNTIFWPAQLEGIPKSFRLKPARSAMEKSMELLLAEMEESNIVKGLAAVRKTCEGDNDDVFKLAEQYPDKFLGIVWVDPLNYEEAIADVDKYVTNGLAIAVSVESGFLLTPEKFNADDKRAYPFYEKCQAEHIPILFSYGGTGALQSYYNPIFIHNVAADFPELTMVLGHGGYPFNLEICQVLQNCPNVFLTPDLYMYSEFPGADIFIKAANGHFQDRILFGSVYPGMPLKAMVDDAIAHLRLDVVDKIMYQNAARVFNIDV